MDDSWVDIIKDEFPSFKQSTNWILCDAAGGTQVHQSVISAISHQLSIPTANLFKGYPSALVTVQGVARAREVAAEFFNCHESEIVFGANMTTITYHLSRSIGKILTNKNNVVVTNLDHDANVSPWVQAASDKNASVRRINFSKSDCTLDLAEVANNIDENTKIVAVGAAANSCGSLTPIKTVVDIIKQRSKGNAWVYIDAAHYAPHRLIDVQDVGCDFLICSAHKFCGPHAGILFGKQDLLKGLIPSKIKACTDLLPGPESCQRSRWETGTASFEAIAGIKATIEYIASIGVKSGRSKCTDTLRKKLQSGYDAILSHENKISEIFLTEARNMNGLTVYGVKDLNDIDKRTPTFCINMEGFTARQLAQELVGRGIACAAGNFYAINFAKLMGLKDVGGSLRISFFHYHTLDDVRKVVKILRDISLSSN